MRSIPFHELDGLLKYFDDGYLVSHDEAYRRFSEVHLTPPTDLPRDPFSPEYAKRYLDLYTKVSQRPEYTVQNERCEFDVDTLSYRPYPYFTKSLKRTAQHYDLMARLFDMMELEEGASILECGFGWGNTTLALASLGYKVTALDIEQKYCDLVEKRASRLKIDNIKFINSDFLWVERTEEKFDAVVYFEAFHHCWEFQRLLKSLHGVIKPGGKIYFGAEPINEQFTVPWGVRLDGESLFVARKSGWMELGFHSSFFEELLKRTGWRGECLHPHFWRATRRGEAMVIPAADDRVKSQIGNREGNKLKVSAPAGNGNRYFALFGPYINLPKGDYDVDVGFSATKQNYGSVTFDICCDFGATRLFYKEMNAQDVGAGPLKARISLPSAVSALEVRLNVPAGFAGELEKITFTEAV